jgi:hypothetical protein
MAEKCDGNDDAKYEAHHILFILSSRNDMIQWRLVSAAMRLAYENPSKCFSIATFHNPNEPRKTHRQVLLVTPHSYDYLPLLVPIFDIPMSLGNFIQWIASIDNRSYLSHP